MIKMVYVWNTFYGVWDMKDGLWLLNLEKHVKKNQIEEVAEEQKYQLQLKIKFVE